MLAHLHVMTTRDNMRAVIEGLQREHGLLAAYLEATAKIDWHALQKQVPIGKAPTPIHVEAASAVLQSPELVPPKSSFVFRRTNVVRVP
jgi:hypothetical protein